MTPGNSSGTSYLIWDQILKLSTLKFMMPLREMALIHCFSTGSWFKFIEYFPKLINNGFRLQDILGNCFGRYSF